MSKLISLLLLVVFSLPARADDAELAQLAAEDQAVRAGGADSRSDDVRREKVLEILAAGGATTPQDKFNAGIVLQHTGLTFCDGKLQSLSAENYLLAHFLFKEAMAGGVKDAKYLVAASIDRYLSFTKGLQRYGTNRVMDQSTGNELLVPIDRSITDQERALYDVPPLQELLSKYPEQPAPNGQRSGG
ncbi:hypothetical protein N800_08865 [Lysobacter daejeonensis GH1-9]|uniref:Lipoprotein n=1 Tax=Lysobacter daejeonensis GH1-9 TaxID=1385517 RepID=A0A0A0F4J6_9GAMM|nr:hypothetical protein [Lysobacter daejeonensis]KGM56297.1 hypothetical protein N800_08865 [Lysobacter daejeonensis GH1-9]